MHHFFFKKAEKTYLIKEKDMGHACPSWKPVIIWLTKHLCELDIGGMLF